MAEVRTEGLSENRESAVSNEVAEAKAAVVVVVVMTVNEDASARAHVVDTVCEVQVEGEIRKKDGGRQHKGETAYKCNPNMLVVREQIRGPGKNSAVFEADTRAHMVDEHDSALFFPWAWTDTTVRGPL